MQDFKDYAALQEKEWPCLCLEQSDGKPDVPNAGSGLRTKQRLLLWHADVPLIDLERPTHTHSQQPDPDKPGYGSSVAVRHKQVGACGTSVIQLQLSANHIQP